MTMDAPVIIIGGGPVGLAIALDLGRRGVLPARARIERLLEWVLPVAAEIGAAEWLRVPEQNAAERQIARFEEGDDLARIYGDLTLSASRVG